MGFNLCNYRMEKKTVRIFGNTIIKQYIMTFCDEK